MTYIPSGKEEAEALKNYDPTKYQNPGVAADTALFAVDGDKLKLLLIKRGGYPYKDCWALPGGFVDINEDISDAAKRELLEETSIRVEYLERAAVWGKPDRDPRARVITVSYIALIDFESTKPIAGDDASQVDWFSITDYIKNVADSSTQISYTLDGPQKFSAIVCFPNERIQEITAIKSGGLAFDHAESIATSIELLKKRVDVIALRSLGKEKAAEAAKIIHNL